MSYKKDFVCLSFKNSSIIINIMSDIYTFDRKKKLSERIQKLATKKEIQAVKNIIVEKNPDLEFMKNSNGHFVQFQNLSNDTYIDITKYLDKNDKRKQKDIDADMEKSVNALTDDINLTDTSQRNSSKKMRLTNTENHILNRLKYEQELKKNETNSDENVAYFSHDNIKSDEIFVQKKAKTSNKK